jgi:hypothetical protein
MDEQERHVALLIAFITQFGIPPMALIGVGAGLVTKTKGPDKAIASLTGLAEEIENHREEILRVTEQGGSIGPPDWCE